MELPAIALGIGAGIVTGLTPGVHVNLVATLALAAGAGAAAVPFLLGLAVTHTFLDTIPGVLLGAPDADTALGVLPGHRYLLRGWGYMAVKLTLVGSLLGLVAATALIPLWWLAIQAYPYLVSVMGYVLLVVSAYLILRDRQRKWAVVVFGLSAILGYLLLNRPLLTDPLFPLFSGLFGTSTLLYSLKSDPVVPPQQIETRIQVRWKDASRAIGAGTFAGFLTSMLPGLGSAQAAIIGQRLSGRVGDHGFLVLLGAVSTVNFTLSLLTWLALDKARNGAVVAMQQLTLPSLLLTARLFAAALLAGGIATFLGIALARKAVRLINRVPYKGLSIGIVALIVALVGILTGLRGLLVLTVATGIGLVPAVTRTSRAQAMGCLLLPVALYFL